jgi:hypothetical protein
VTYPERNSWHCKAILVFAVGLLATIPTRASLATDLGGTWTGHWQSCSTGHKGPLNATFCATNDAEYLVQFSGRFFKILPFRYSVTLRVVSDDGENAALAGSSYLGRLFGTFYYQANATETRFVANFSSRKDRGQFVLCRTSARGSH